MSIHDFNVHVLCYIFIFQVVFIEFVKFISVYPSFACSLTTGNLPYSFFMLKFYFDFFKVLFFNGTDKSLLYNFFPSFKNVQQLLFRMNKLHYQVATTGSKWTKQRSQYNGPQPMEPSITLYEVSAHQILRYNFKQFFYFKFLIKVFS